MSREISYTIEDGDLITLSNGHQIWHGRPGNRPVSSAMRARRGDDAIVMYHIDYHSGENYDNLARCTPDGEVVWIAGRHGVIADAYCSVFYKGASLQAITYCGFECVIDDRNGAVISYVYMK